MSSATVSTLPPGHETLAAALVSGLAAARRARPAQHVRIPAAPKPSSHDAVDAWTATHAGALAVRGWLCVSQAGDTVRFAAHSLVRAADGKLLDPTFLPTDPVLPFVPHPRQVGGFFAHLCMRDAPHELVVLGVPDEGPQ
ncbi:hypothetical protein C9I57_26650 [Trinickia symbiotica]|uniref:Uncharacterized protein n=1 Tax=Trinickia symbiotica TaxID=863227 RepID=A0A2T3XMV6_9BURK|nr:hypothetical protein [Trinickia symbiotica]PTB17797.1 hypothetical protein C9I57_26650 [Trinickia symbiotica]